MGRQNTPDVYRMVRWVLDEEGVGDVGEIRDNRGRGKTEGGREGRGRRGGGGGVRTEQVKEGVQM